MKAKPTKAKKKGGRDKWNTTAQFVITCIGSSIGLGNIYKFPYLTQKHGGVNFIVTYLIALMTVGIPMLILELTLGQKMQKGSAGALRGITPRLGGIGWASSFTAFITALVYVIFLSIACIYLVTNGSQPWAIEWEDRPIGCKTAHTAPTTGSEIFLYMQITKYFSPQTCEPFEYGNEEFIFGGELFGAVVIIWLLCFACICKGIKGYQWITVVTVPLPFILLFACMAYYIPLNNANVAEGEATGSDFYWGTEGFPLIAPDQYGGIYYDPAAVADKRFSDAVNHAFFSVGVCVGVMYAYGSFQPIKAPVIRNAFVIAFTDFIFSILAGFVAWSVIGFL